MIHERLPNKRKLKKPMQCPFIKSPSLWYGSDFSFKNNYYAFIVKLFFLIFILNGVSSNLFKFINGAKFNWCISISYTIKKFTQEFHPQP